MIIRTSLIGFVLLSISTIAQTDITIKGKIIDAETKASLGYASISLKGKPIGTISNTDGEFEFHISGKDAQDTLYVSMLGYGSYQRIVKEVDSDKFITVGLKSAPVILDELVVKDNTLSPNQIFQNAYKNLKQNFPQEPYLLKCFYRQLNTENGKNLLLIETAADIYDKGYRLENTFNLKEKVSINQVRSSLSNFKNPYKNYFEQSNTLTWLMLFNFTKYRNKYVMERTNFTLDSMVYINDQPAYVISTISSGTQLINQFTLHIDAETFAFLKIKNESVAKSGQFLQNFDVPVTDDQSKMLKLVYSSQTYQFKNYKGKMYLEQAISYSKGQIINIKTDEVEWTVTDENNLVVYEVLTEAIKAPKKNIMDKKKNLKSLHMTYVPDFWKNYNLVKMIPLSKQQIRDLESKESLEDQFTKQGTKDK